MDSPKTKILSLTLLAAITYGIIHDEVTSHLCVEYFTVAHPLLFHTDSPALLGLCWGVFATAGIGAVMGVLLAEVSQSVGPPSYPVTRVLRLVLRLLAVMASAATLAGIAGFELSSRSILTVPQSFSIAPAHRDRFMAVWFAHGASYLTGIGGGALLILQVWRRRGRPRIITAFPRSRPAMIRMLIVIAIAIAILCFRYTAATR